MTTQINQNISNNKFILVDAVTDKDLIQGTLEEIGQYLMNKFESADLEPLYFVDSCAIREKEIDHCHTLMFSPINGTQRYKNWIENWYPFPKVDYKNMNANQALAFKRLFQRLAISIHRSHEQPYELYKSVSENIL
ncbi:hypothetical protein HW132_07100 [Brasilonema sp. CT11]|nr:hypothetical protein [Brasilonema sp. CT11]